MSVERKNLMNELYNANLVTIGAVAVSMVSKKATGEQLGAPNTVKGTLKLGSSCRCWECWSKIHAIKEMDTQ